MKYLWDIIFSVTFSVLIGLGLWWLYATGRFEHDAPVLDLVLMSLAIWRLIRLVTYDHVTDILRDSFAASGEGTIGSTLKSLIECPWCSGLWASAIVVFAYYATPFSWPVILILALAAVGSFLQIFANLVGWYAEGEKHEVKVAKKEDPLTE
ncbi:MAG: hypothetical protein AB199_03705 [Parcubacteria bacterium C7867-004]|nr:MAG: hypothetical protein AB199_03705 [Parcubacteria bacterium C7867-004]